MFRHYYPDRFPTLWTNFSDLIDEGRLVSVSEVSRELGGQEDRLSDWVKDSAPFFHDPTVEELVFVAEIFKVPHFRQLISQQQTLQGKPVADPFVIAKATCTPDGCVLTSEKPKNHAAKIPNVCDHFGVPYTDLESFMETEGWAF